MNRRNPDDFNVCPGSGYRVDPTFGIATCPDCGSKVTVRWSGALAKHRRPTP